MYRIRYNLCRYRNSDMWSVFLKKTGRDCTFFWLSSKGRTRWNIFCLKNSICLRSFFVSYLSVFFYYWVFILFFFYFSRVQGEIITHNFNSTNNLKKIVSVLLLIQNKQMYKQKIKSKKKIYFIEIHILLWR